MSFPLRASVATLLFGELSAAEPQPHQEKTWPRCIIDGMALRTGKPVFADVRQFIKHVDSHRHRTITFSSNGPVGMLLQEDPHDLGEVVKDVLNNSQAYSSGVRKNWIITRVDGKEFKAKERLKDVADDFEKAKKFGETLTVTFDIRTFMDCTNGDCTNSDKFPTDDAESCADACATIQTCDWWSWGEQDEDLMCWLQAQQGSSLMKWEGLQTAPRACAPHPANEAAHTDLSWPSCQVKDSRINMEGGQVFADVSKFIRYGDDVRHKVLTFKSEGDVGMVLRDKPHPEGEYVSEVNKDSQAYQAGVRQGWIIKEVDGQPFKKNEDLPGVGHDFQSAKEKAPTIIVKFDVRTSVDCTNGECTHSDKFPSASESECAAACSEVPDCKWWTYAVENEDPMCFLRSSDRGIKPAQNAVSGKRECSPPKHGVLYKIMMMCLFAAAVFYRKELTERALALPIVQTLLNLPLVSMVKNKFSKTRENDYDDFSFGGGSTEEKRGLVDRYGRPPMDFDEL